MDAALVLVDSRFFFGGGGGGGGGILFAFEEFGVVAGRDSEKNL